jgi:hypothetical protein
MSSGGRSTREGMVMDAAGAVWWYGGKACVVVGFCWTMNYRSRITEIVFYVLWLIVVGRRRSLDFGGQTYSLVYVFCLCVVGRRGLHRGGQTQS